ncbi:redoxin domain-containing protein [Pasteuria penetrans]|uniref:redoxin domain-containing protein n=1 Tax=Pasteuria penetrans TaxID=86005 RepID=UPI000FB9ECAF|nr:redoxin domain-containing protein [Pasteuria penetrans]
MFPNGLSHTQKIMLRRGVLLVLATIATVVIIRGVNSDTDRLAFTSEGAPDFTLPLLHGNESYRLRESLSVPGRRGAVLTFFTTSCEGCERVLSVLQKFRGEYQSQGIDMLLINVGEGRYAVEQKMGDSVFPIALDIHKTVFNHYRLAFVPVTLILDPEGRIRSKKWGVISLPELKGQLRSLGMIKDTP